MPKNPSFRRLIALPPVVVLVMLVGLIALTSVSLFRMHQQNNEIQRWGRVSDSLQIAIAAGERMRTTAAGLQVEPDKEDLHFEYLEQSRIFFDNVFCSDCRSVIQPEVMADLEASQALLRHREDLQSTQVIHQLNNLLPRLEYQYKVFRARKRSQFLEYYETLEEDRYQLLVSGLVILVICVLSASVLTYWTWHILRRRVSTLVAHARAIASGQWRDLETPEEVRDELDELTCSLSVMSQRLSNVIAVEKVLQGVEKERKRMAMDMHDQTLADLTGLQRRLETLAQGPHACADEARELTARVMEISESLRGVIDNLHPQTLDVLGLDVAVRSYLKKTASLPGMPEYQLKLDTEVCQQLDEFKRVMLYRIITEAVNNLLRYAKCSHYEIELRRLDKNWVLSVEDNGVGFDYREALNKPGHGLRNLQQRAQAIGASIHWEASRFTSGTRLRLVLPVKEH
ncbi:MAG: HAMP domain-containing protein [Gammaproteobacteria bacterium]